MTAHAQTRVEAEPSCRDCGVTISRKGRTGRCRRCHHTYIQTDPEIMARRAAGSRAAKQRPEVRANLSKAARKAMASPERREINRQWCLQSRWWEGSTCHSPEANAKRGAAVSETRMAWCPPEYREEAKAMVRSGRKRHAEVKAIIAARVERDKLRPLMAYVADAASYVSTHDRCPVLRSGEGQWRYGNGIRTDEQLIAMAVRKGWQRMDLAA